MLHVPTTSETEFAKRSLQFHASISERAAKMSPQVKAPYVPTKQAINPVPYWRDMWFYNLVRFGENYIPGKQSVRRIDIRNIQNAVCRYYGVKITDLVSDRRASDVILPRHVAMYLAKELTPKSLMEIGRAFRKRDHTTIFYAARKIEKLLKIYPELAADILTISLSIKDETI